MLEICVSKCSKRFSKGSKSDHGFPCTQVGNCHPSVFPLFPPIAPPPVLAFRHVNHPGGISNPAGLGDLRAIFTPKKMVDFRQDGWGSCARWARWGVGCVLPSPPRAMPQGGRDCAGRHPCCPFCAGDAGNASTAP